MSSLFVYPKFTPEVDLPTSGIDQFYDKATKCWLEKVLLENFGERILKVAPYRIRPWSKVLRVEGTKGLYFLKIPAAEFDKEAEFLVLLARLEPNIIPQVLARNKFNGAFLTASLTGDTLRVIERKHFNESLFEHSAKRVGVLQKNARSYLTEFEKLNIRTWTSSTIIEDCRVLIQNLRYLSHSRLSSAALLDFSVLLSYIHEKLDILTFLDNGLSIDHGDFQDNNIFISEDRMFFLDWADVSISIPSFTIGTYCHSILLAHPRLRGNPSFIENILGKYYSTLLGIKPEEIYQFHPVLLNCLYPVISILKVGRLLNLEETDSDKYVSSIIDYWILTVISLRKVYCDKTLGNKII